MHEFCEVCEKEPVAVVVGCGDWDDELVYKYVGLNCLKTGNLPFLIYTEGAVILLQDGTMIKLAIESAEISVKGTPLPVIGNPSQLQTVTPRYECMLICNQWLSFADGEKSLLNLFNSGDDFNIKFCKKGTYEKMKGIGKGRIYQYKPQIFNDDACETVHIEVLLSSFEMVRT